MNKLQKILDAKGLKIKWLSQQTGISIYRLSGILNDKREPKLSDIELIAKALNLPIDVIFFDRDISVCPNRNESHTRNRKKKKTNANLPNL